jgi:uncharacterized protein (TIGR03000 family)
MMGRTAIAVGLLILASSPALAQATPSRSEQPGYYTEDYAGAAEEKPDQKLPARIRVRLPANAQVFINGEKTTSTGTIREYETPELNPERVYTYLVRATWVEDGITVEKRLRVRALSGNRVTINFVPVAQERPRAVRISQSSAPPPRIVPPTSLWNAPYP